MGDIEANIRVNSHKDDEYVEMAAEQLANLLWTQLMLRAKPKKELKSGTGVRSPETPRSSYLERNDSRGQREQSLHRGDGSQPFP